ncbi:MAG: GAF domain-containing protein [Actinomycetota bacterium]
MSTSEPGRELDRSDQSALYRIAALGTRDGDLSVAVRDALRAISDIVPCDRALVFIYDDEKDDLRSFVAQGGERDRLSLNEPDIVRRVFHSGRAEIVNDVASDRDFSPSLEEIAVARTILLAPLILGDERLGVIAAVDSPRGAFTDTERDHLALLADRIAASIRLALQTQTIERQEREMEGLQRLSRLMEAQESLEYVIGESIRIVNDLVECEKVLVFLYNEEGRELRLEPPALGLGDEIGTVTIPLEEPSLASTVFRTAAPIISNDAALDAWVSPRLRDLFGMRNAIAVPLSTDRQPIGVIEAINSKKGSFDDEDLRFTTLFGDRIGGVIELSRARVRERALMHKLREADQAKSDFVSILAHELKGPMTTIMGFGQTLEEHWETIEDSKRVQFLGIVHRETERLSHMVSDLLDMSRMESGTLRYEFEPMALPELIDSIITVHTSLGSRHGIKIEVPSGLPDVLADRERIRQVILNLLTNATRYSPEGTTITLSAAIIGEGESRSVDVSVADEGIGIAPEDTERIFNKFAMLPKPAWTKKGTGLGLFITKGIIDAHGGRLWIDSEPGQGSTFHFTLSLASPKEPVSE